MHRIGFLKTAIFSLIPFVLLLLVTEIVLTLFGIGQPFIRESHFWSGGMRLMQSDPHTGYRMQPNFSEGPVKLNSLGLRDDELDPKADIKILSMGDSCAFGWQINDVRQIYAKRLEQSLNGELLHAGRNSHVNVVNAGVPSFTTYQGLELYLHYLKPLARWDFMVVSFGWNENPDIELDLEFSMRNAPIENRFIRTVRDKVARRLHLYNALESFMYHHLVNAVEDPYLQAQFQYEKYYAQLVRSAQQSGTRVIIMAVIVPPDAHLALDERMRVFNGIVRGIAEREGAIWLDLNDEFDRAKRSIRWFDECHYDKKGHETVAKKLNALLLPLCLEKAAGKRSL